MNHIPCFAKIVVNLAAKLQTASIFLVLMFFIAHGCQRIRPYSYILFAIFSAVKIFGKINGEFLSDLPFLAVNSFFPHRIQR